MHSVSLELKERIRSLIDLRELLLSEGLPLRRSGDSLRGDCPFEAREGKQRPRSVRFRVRGRTYNCYGCGRYGDVFRWYQDWHGLSFPQALRAAAERSGVSLEDLGPRARRTADPKVVACQAALAALSDLSLTHASSMIDGAAFYGDIDLAALVQQDECGKFPEKGKAEEYLRRLGFDESTISALGLTPGTVVEDRWVLWVRDRSGAVRAGRVLGEPGLVLGPKGRRTTGWVNSSNALATSRIKQETVIAADERVYLAARAAGIDHVFLPLNYVSVRRVVNRLPHIDSIQTPPIVLAWPTREGRRRALDIALQLQRLNPRVRVSDLDVTVRDTGASNQWSGILMNAIDRAGTIFDWQAMLLARHGLFDTPKNRRRAAFELHRIVAATRSPLERIVYSAEIENLTGCRPEEYLPNRARRNFGARSSSHRMQS